MRGAKDFFGLKYTIFWGWGRGFKNIWLVLGGGGGGGEYNLTSYCLDTHVYMYTGQAQFFLSFTNCLTSHCTLLNLFQNPFSCEHFHGSKTQHWIIHLFFIKFWCEDH